MSVTFRAPARATTLLSFALLTTAALAGCHGLEGGDSQQTYREMGFDGENWPDLTGTTVTILDHGAFGAFDDAATAFNELTGATVEHVEADDAGSALRQAELERGNPTFDVIYGIDNVLMTKAIDADVFEPYQPLLSDRIDPDHLFTSSWFATPVDHGYVAINWDPNNLDGEVQTLDDLVTFADQFVTQDPRTSSPGLAFLLATISTYGTDDEYDYLDYWQELFDGGVLVTSGWTEAYEQHFSGGYGPSVGGAGDKPIATSYTTSPAYETFFGAEEVANVLTTTGSTFHQIETMGIAKGTPNLAAAQAWIEFTLTDAFQELLAPSMAVYPTVKGVSTDDTFGNVDPAPGTFTPADLTHETIGANVDDWVQAWTDLCESKGCA